MFYKTTVLVGITVGPHLSEPLLSECSIIQNGLPWLSVNCNMLHATKIKSNYMYTKICFVRVFLSGLIQTLFDVSPRERME